MMRVWKRLTAVLLVFAMLLPMAMMYLKNIRRNMPLVSITDAMKTVTALMVVMMVMS